MLKTTCEGAKGNLKALCDQVTQNREIVIVDCAGGERVALIAADDLTTLLETAHLMRSPRNARRLIGALQRALKRDEHPKLRS